MEKEKIKKGRLLVGITGASGSIYALSFLKEAKKLGIKTDVIFTQAGKRVWEYELGISFKEVLNYAEKIYQEHEMFSPPASGSSGYSGMVVIPCSMGTLSAIACGSSRNLLQRSADVMLKEKKTLVLVIRETPLNLIHIKNMETCAQAGAVIFPAMPSFYHRPRTLEDLVSQFAKRILWFLGFLPEGFFSWGSSFPEDTE